MKKFFSNIFYKPQKKSFILTNDFLSFLTIISVISISAETVKSLEDYKNLFYFIEIFSTTFFSIEYLGRIIAAPKASKYIFSFFGFIDLLSILPTILGLGNLTFLKSARLFRILRFLRILRLAKIARYTKDNLDKENNNNLVKINLGIYFTAFILFAFFSAVTIWLVEGNSSIFSDIPTSLIWSIKILLGGVPQTIPVTFWGEIILIITRFFGLILLALMINLIANIFKNFILNKK